MELEHTTVKELKLYDSVVREQPVEADLVLPEYYPAVGRILKCFICPAEEAVTFADGRVSVAGTAAVRLLYADDENRLHCYQTETKYTKILQTEVRDEQASVRVTQHVRTLNYKALGPKRVEIKANIAVKAELLGIVPAACVTWAGDGMQLRTGTTDYCEPVCVYCRNFTESDTVRCEAGGKKLCTVIASSAVPVVEKTEVIPNKIMVRGKNNVTVICADEAGGIGRYELSVPFSEVLDCYGAGDQSSCFVTFTRCRAEVLLSEDGDNTFDVSVENEALLLSAEKKELVCVTDAYALYGDAECRFSELTPARAFSQTEEEVSLTAEAEAFEDGGFTVKSVFVGDISCAAAGRSDGACMEGDLCVNVLIADSENRLSLLSKNVAFSYPLPAGVQCLACAVTPKSMRAETRTEGKIAVFCTLSCQMLTQCGERVRLLSEVKTGEGDAAVRQEKAVIYFAEKGETLWNIAKENRTSVANIKAFNALSSEVVEADTRLIFAGY